MESSDSLSERSIRWIVQERGVSTCRPPAQLVKRGIAERVGRELMYPPAYQLTKAGRELQAVLLVEKALRR